MKAYMNDIIHKFIYLFNTVSSNNLCATIYEIKKIIQTNEDFDNYITSILYKNPFAKLAGFYIIENIIRCLRETNMYSFLRYLIINQVIFPCVIYFWDTNFDNKKNRTDLLNALIWSSDIKYSEIYKKAWTINLLNAMAYINHENIFFYLNPEQFDSLVLYLQPCDYFLINDIDVIRNIEQSKRFAWIYACISKCNMQSE
jgi:hypothetical protein